MSVDELDTHQQLLTLLENIRAFTGVDLIYKNALDYPDSRMPEYAYNHCGVFCKEVKKIPSNMELCYDDDIRTTFFRVRSTKESFVKTCHAGVIELVVPHFSNGAFQGVFYLGPMRSDDSKSMKENLLPYCKELPVFDATKIECVKKILEVICSGLKPLRPVNIQTPLRTNKEALKKRIEIALKFIEENYTRQLSVEDVAYCCFLSPSRFMHLFKQITGLTFRQQLAKTRIDAAKRLLTYSSLDINHITIECGFGSVYYFSDAFRRATGYSPGEYRKQNSQLRP